MLKLGSINAPGFADNLRAALRRVMRAQALLALRTRSGAAAPGFCIDNDMDYDPRRCPQQPQGKPFVVTADAKAKLTVTNTADTPRHLYVYAIDKSSRSICCCRPAAARIRRCWRACRSTRSSQPDQCGAAIASSRSHTAADAPIGSARALEQSGQRGAGTCSSALERLVCEAASGTRDASVPRVATWVATVTDVLVK